MPPDYWPRQAVNVKNGLPNDAKSREWAYPALKLVLVVAKFIISLSLYTGGACCVRHLSVFTPVFFTMLRVFAMNDQTGPAFKGRVEDIRFVSGHGRFTADIVPDNALHAVFLRSNVAAGVITSLDSSAAKTAPGVVSVLTALDAAADGVANMVWTGGPVREDGGVTVDSPRPLLSEKKYATSVSQWRW